MYEFIQSDELKTQARRLLGYRLPLVLVILVNIVLIMRVPMPGTTPAHAGNSVMTTALEFLHRPASHQDSYPLQSGLSSVPDAVASREQGSVAPMVSPERTDWTPLVEALTSDDRAATRPDSSAGTQWLVSTGSSAAESIASVWAQLPRLGLPISQWRGTAHLVAQRWMHATHDALQQTEHDPVESASDSRRSGTSMASAADSPSLEDPVTNSAPAQPAATVTTNTWKARDNRLAICNPAGNGETVRFLVNGRLCELQPGEAHYYAPGDEWLIQFHPGGDFDDVERTLQRGTYQFIVTPYGWDIVAVQASQQ